MFSYRFAGSQLPSIFTLCPHLRPVRSPLSAGSIPAPDLVHSRSRLILSCSSLPSDSSPLSSCSAPAPLSLHFLFCTRSRLALSPLPARKLCPRYPLALPPLPSRSTPSPLSLYPRSPLSISLSRPSPLPFLTMLCCRSLGAPPSVSMKTR